MDYVTETRRANNGTLFKARSVLDITEIEVPVFLNDRKNNF